MDTAFAVVANTFAMVTKLLLFKVCSVTKSISKVAKLISNSFQMDFDFVVNSEKL